MKYIFKERYILTPMNNLDGITKAVVYEPSLELAQLYAKYLRQQNFEPYICGSHAVMISLASAFSPHILIYNIDSGLEGLKSLKRAHPSILIITIGDLPDTQLDALMDLGISGHINRKVTRPRDVGILARQLLKY